ncbi:hypothetical protein C7M84_007005 [Penaeus vannamei]|uniref:Uncharacterized protein n=1 Tax=Penaeus vannamei TaxID=6689 RepID=A0A423TDM7_PENVA|nr:hypothetical protein C7M84_007005 [Penaeus vannamei]
MFISCRSPSLPPSLLPSSTSYPISVQAPYFPFSRPSYLPPSLCHSPSSSFPRLLTLSNHFPSFFSPLIPPLAPHLALFPAPPLISLLSYHHSPPSPTAPPSPPPISPPLSSQPPSPSLSFHLPIPHPLPLPPTSPSLFLSHSPPPSSPLPSPSSPPTPPPLSFPTSHPLLAPHFPSFNHVRRDGDSPNPSFSPRLSFFFLIKAIDDSFFALPLPSFIGRSSSAPLHSVRPLSTNLKREKIIFFRRFFSSSSPFPPFSFYSSVHLLSAFLFLFFSFPFLPQPSSSLSPPPPVPLSSPSSLLPLSSPCPPLSTLPLSPSSTLLPLSSSCPLFLSSPPGENNKEIQFARRGVKQHMVQRAREALSATWLTNLLRLPFDVSPLT